MRKVGAVVLMAAVLGFAVGGSSNASTSRSRFVRLPGRGAHPAFVPATARLDTSVVATVRLGATPLTARLTAVHAAADDGTGRSGTASEAATIRQSVLAGQVPVAEAVARLGGEVLYQLTDTANAVVVRIPSSRLSALDALPGVVGVDESRQLQRDNTIVNAYTGASTAWRALGITGRGQKIAIIDDGVDYNHADFGGSGNAADTTGDSGTTIGTANFPSAKVAGGYDFVGDAFDASSSDANVRTPRPDPDPLSCGTHGTHVAGTAAGVGVTADGRPYAGPYDPVSVAGLAIGPGAAPEATIYAYKVFGCDGSTTNAVVAAAIDRAVAEGVDVISLSLGSPYGSTTSIDAEAIANAVRAGVTVVASAGNDGPAAYLVDSPSTADGAISVGALDASLPEFRSAVLRLPTEASAIVANDAPLTSVTGLVRIITDERVDAQPPAVATTISLGCRPDDYTFTRPGDIVVVKRGTCTRTEKARLAAAAGAAAVILVNTQAGLPPFEGRIPGVAVPFLGVQSNVGTALLAVQGTALTVIAGPTIVNGGYGKMANFSAGGPRNGDSAMKPDLSAPGVSIFSASAGTGSGGLRESGTSMAVPHVAGLAALVHEAHPTWTPAEVKGALMNTADATTARVREYNMRLSGSGVVDAVRAVSTAAVATTADGTNALSFGYRPARAGMSPQKTFAITNHSATPLTYDLSSAFNATVGTPAADRGALIEIEPSVVTVPPGGSVEVGVTISMSASVVAKLPDASQPAGSVVLVRGSVTATPREAGALPLRVPFGLVPRGLSDVRAEPPAALTVAGDTATGTMALSNRGIHRGTADLYAWLLADDVDHDTSRSTADLRSVGVQTYPGLLLGSSIPDDLAVVFSVNVEESWSTASTGEIDLPIDVNADGVFDFTLVGADYGAVMNGSDNGNFAAFLFDRTGVVVDVFLADAPMNGSTLLLPALTSDLGITPASPPFTVRAQSFDRLSRVFDVMPGTARWQPFHPAVSTADLVDLTAASATELAVTVNLTDQAVQQVRGWLVVTLDDRNGESQADRVALAGLLPG